MKRTAAPPAPAAGPSAGPKKPLEVSNGQTPAPLTYSSGEPSDDVNMNEVDDKVTLNVFLTSGKSTTVTVDANIPMLDLLVHLAGRCKVSPSGHELQVREEETGKVLEFKANQTIGSLGATSVYLLAKSRKPDWSQAAKVSKAAMAFEITQRFTINLPGGQKAVMRVSPQMTLGQVLARVCQDKSLDTRRYTLQHPSQPHTPLPLHHTIADSKLSEINLVHVTGDNRPGPGAVSQRPPAQTSSTAAVSGSQDPASWYMPSAGETKKKKGFLSFLSKKEKKFKLDSHHNLETSSTSSRQSSSALSTPRSSTPPPDMRSSRGEGPARRPHTMYVTSSPQESPREGLTDNSKAQPRNSPREELKDSPRGQVTVPKDSGEPKAPPRGGGKKRPAPPPPQARAAASEDVVKASSAAPVAAAAPPSSSEHTLSSTTPEASSGSDLKPHVAPASGEVSVTVKPGSEVTNASLLHSRNSSDSSGYHELTLSGAESPEAAHLPTTFKTSIDTTSIDSGDNLNGDSGIQDMSPAADGACRVGGSGEEQQGWGRADPSRPQGVMTAHGADSAKTLPSTKKKKAPPPPPKAKPAPVQEETIDMTTDETDLPCTERPPTPLQADEPPPPPPPAPTAADEVVAEDPPAPPAVREEAPPSLKLNLDFLEESDTDTETRTDKEEADTKPPAPEKSEASEAFDLDDILNSVVFDEEPRRTSISIHTATTAADPDPEGREMAMVETGSVVSEEVEVVEDFRSRPCEFIPPPPPEEPPPEDYSPRGSGPRYADKSTVVGEDNVSLAPASLKNSPVARERGSRADRRPSDDPSPDLTSELPPLSSHVTSADLPLPLPDLPVEEVKDSGVWQERHQPDSRDDQQSTQRDSDHPEAPSQHGEDGDDVVTMGTAFAMTEEISAPLETVPPPLQFQTEEDEKEEEEEDEKEEEEEEEVVTVTEEYIIPVGPGGLDFSAAIKVREEEEKSGGQAESSSSRDVGSRDPESGAGGEKKGGDSLGSVTKRESESASHVQEDVVERKAQPPAEKEEFVLTLEDLSSVSLVPLRPKKYSPPKAAPTPAPAEEEVVSEASGGGSPQRAHLHLAYVSDHGHVQPASSSSSTAHQPALTTPAFRTHLVTAKESSATPSPPSLSPRPDPEPAKAPEESDHSYRSTASLALGGGRSQGGHPDSGDRHGQADVGRNSRVTDVPSEAPASAAQGGVDLQQQYSALQDQFTVWQQQLQQNQTLLAASGGGGGGANPNPDDTLKTLQMQMQMQQQMMEQLQRSMQALTVQQRSVVQQGRVSPQPSGVQVTVTPASPPPPPPPAPVPAPAAVKSVARAPAKKITTQPVSARFQPQLDPREELMIAIRSFGGISGLNTVPVRDTRWASGKQ